MNVSFGLFVLLVSGVVLVLWAIAGLDPSWFTVVSGFTAGVGAQMVMREVTP